MNESISEKIRLSFPGDLEYIPAVRKFIADILLVDGFSSKFAYRSEIIIDEICNNAVVYGCKSLDDVIDLTCKIFSDRIEINVKDKGGTGGDIQRLRKALKFEDDKDLTDFGREAASEKVTGLGFEIIRMLSENVEFEIDENNLTSIKVVRKREQDFPEETQM